MRHLVQLFDGQYVLTTGNFTIALKFLFTWEITYAWEGFFLHSLVIISDFWMQFIFLVVLMIVEDIVGTMVLFEVSLYFKPITVSYVSDIGLD